MKTSRAIEVKDRFLVAMLPHVPFDGWSRKALYAGCKDLSEDSSKIDLVFGDDMGAVARHYGSYVNREMLKRLDGIDLDGMAVSERIITSITVRLDLLAPHKETVRRLLAFLALPNNNLTALKLVLETVDQIWRVAGDKSTDINYYTKRGTLAGVYSSTILFWLSDFSDSHFESIEFLRRRINDVLQIPSLKRRVNRPVVCINRVFRRLIGFSFR